MRQCHSFTVSDHDLIQENRRHTVTMNVQSTSDQRKSKEKQNKIRKRDWNAELALLTFLFNYRPVQQSLFIPHPHRYNHHIHARYRTIVFTTPINYD